MDLNSRHLRERLKENDHLVVDLLQRFLFFFFSLRRPVETRPFSRHRDGDSCMSDPPSYTPTPWWASVNSDRVAFSRRFTSFFYVFYGIVFDRDRSHLPPWARRTSSTSGGVLENEMCKLLRARADPPTTVNTIRSPLAPTSVALPPGRSTPRASAHPTAHRRDPTPDSRRSKGSWEQPPASWPSRRGCCRRSFPERPLPSRWFFF